MTEWHVDMRNKLAELWPTHSASIIGGILGKSRSAIIGMVHRMGLPAKKPSGGPPKKKRQQPVARFVSRVELPIEPPVLPKSEKAVSILEASYYQCRAVIDPTGSPEGLAMFCGEPVEEGKFYKFCAYHMKKYTAPSRRGDFYIPKWGVK